MAALAGVLLSPDAVRAVRNRDRPLRLARMRVPLEGWVAGVVVGLASLLTLGGALSGSEVGLDRFIGVLLGLWIGSGIMVCATVLVVVVRSRITQREQWAELDFIERHLPKHGASPQTSEEYRAVRLASSALSDVSGPPVTPGSEHEDPTGPDRG